MRQFNKVALLGTHGLPARHGAFEQAVAMICDEASKCDVNIHFIVGCASPLRSLEYDQHHVTRVFAARGKGIFVLWYDLVSSIKAYFLGARTFIYFGYEFAPFFPIFRLLGTRVVCNVDGIEWRRAKWGVLAKRYFRACEWIAARSASDLVFDAMGIARYYGINHGVSGHLIFYGSEDYHDLSAEFDLETGSYFTVVMRMEPENNIKIIIEGFLKSNSQKYLILIGPSTDFFDRECLPLIDGVRVRYLGPIYDREKLIAIRKNSYAYIHGHSVGGTNPTLIEAVSLNNRVIAFNSIFNREVCGHQAYYFLSSDDLACLIDQDNLPPPPKLTDLYEWRTVARKYFELCG